MWKVLANGLIFRPFRLQSNFKALWNLGAGSYAARSPLEYGRENMTDLLQVVQRILCWPGKIVSWLIIPLILTIILSIIAAHQGWSVLLEWQTSIPVFGDAITVNSLVDGQWFMFALIVLFGGVWTFVDDRHVTVDFLAIGFSQKVRAYISIFCNIVFLLPLCAIVAVYGWKFAHTSFTTNEGSIQGGLEAYWLIKGALPVSFILLGVAAITNSVLHLISIINNQYADLGSHHDS